MRVAVVGATGNAGTAVLRALGETPEVESVLGIARRLPDTTVEPYAGCDWASIDIAASTTEAEAASQLEEAFAGVDAVIHLAWLIQPNSDRALLRRVNVEGTARVARAAAQAGVGHLVVASSVGAYSPDKTQRLRDESWPTGGIEPSHYSIDKAAQEQVLDEFSAAHSEVVVTRLRPALIFQADAAYEIQRYFLNSWLPVKALDYAKPPVLPLPKGLRGVQAVHADDIGRAYAAAVVAKVPGAFNICADDILGRQELADIVDHGRYLELPARLVRAFLFGGHKAKLIAADEGWIDMALGVPMMDNSRAKSELGWEPRHTAADALQSLISGMIDGQGVESVPLRPKDPDEANLPSARGPAGSGAAAGDGPSVEDRSGGAAGAGADGDSGIAEEVSRDLLNLYLSDHLTGATAGGERIERMAEAYIDTPMFAKLSQLAEEIRLERAFLQKLIHGLGMKQMPYRQAVSWVGERVGRLKSNGRLLSRSPMTMVLEAELMRSAVVGKLGVWQTLEDNSELLSLDPQVFVDLADRTRRQAEILDEVHEYARKRAFRDDRETFTPYSPESRDEQAAEEQTEERKMMTAEPPDVAPEAADENTKNAPETPQDKAERPGADNATKQEQDELVDEWVDDSFPTSDPPAHY
jgi:UDP-glucose 4-epimerase